MARGASDTADITDLSRGDRLVADAAADAEVIVHGAGIPKFGARLGAAEGKRAVRIIRRLDPPSVS